MNTLPPELAVAQPLVKLDVLYAFVSGEQLAALDVVKQGLDLPHQLRADPTPLMIRVNDEAFDVEGRTRFVGSDRPNNLRLPHGFQKHPAAEVRTQPLTRLR